MNCNFFSCLFYARLPEKYLNVWNKGHTHIFLHKLSFTIFSYNSKHEYFLYFNVSNPVLFYLEKKFLFGFKLLGLLVINIVHIHSFIIFSPHLLLYLDLSSRISWYSYFKNKNAFLFGTKFGSGWFYHITCFYVFSRVFLLTV